MNTRSFTSEFQRTDKGQVGWLGSVALMMKTQIGLGVLSIPAVFNSLGMIPGIICLLAIAVITTWSDYMVGAFKLKHPEVYGIDDVGQLLFGRIGKEVMGLAYVLCEYSPHAYVSPDITDVQTRLDLRRWLRHAQHLDRSQRTFAPWRLYCRLCRRGCCHWLHIL